MKKIFKALAIAAASAAMCVGVAMSTGCTGGSGTYYGGYHYIGAHSATPYGMVVEVTVENNIITSVKDITNTDNENAKNIQTYKDVIDGKEATEATLHSWTVVSTGWETYFNQLVNLPYAWILTYGYDLTKNGLVADGYDAATDANSLYYVELDADGNRTNKAIKWEKGVIPAPAATNIHSYGWTDKACSNWTSHESWLLAVCRLVCCGCSCNRRSYKLRLQACNGCRRQNYTGFRYEFQGRALRSGLQRRFERKRTSYFRRDAGKRKTSSCNSERSRQIIKTNNIKTRLTRRVLFCA